MVVGFNGITFRGRIGDIGVCHDGHGDSTPRIAQKTADWRNIKKPAAHFRSLKPGIHYSLVMVIYFMVICHCFQ